MTEGSLIVDRGAIVVQGYIFTVLFHRIKLFKVFNVSLKLLGRSVKFLWKLLFLERLRVVHNSVRNNSCVLFREIIIASEIHGIPQSYSHNSVRNPRNFSKLKHNNLILRKSFAFIISPLQVFRANC